MRNPQFGSVGTRNLVREVLIASLDPDGEKFHQRAITDWPSLPWHWLHHLALTHKVAALFAARMGQHYLREFIPEPFRTKFDQVEESAGATVLHSTATLRAVAAAFAARNIPFLVIKGSAIARAYGDPALRPFRDLDVVVPEYRLADADQALMDLGYRFYNDPVVWTGPARRKTLSDQDARHQYRVHHRHFPYVAPDGDGRLPVDLHWRLANPGVLERDPAGAWEETASFQVDGLEVRTLNAEATLVHTAVHAMEQNPRKFKLLHLCDLEWLLQRAGSSLRPARVREIARQWGAEQHLICALEAASLLFPFSMARKVPELGRWDRWSETCLRLGGWTRYLVNHGGPAPRPLRFPALLYRESLWDLALHRPPRSVPRSVSGAFLALLHHRQPRETV